MRRKRLFVFPILAALAALVIQCGKQQEQPAAPAGMESIIPAGAQLEKVTGDTLFDTAGSPCWVNGVLFFTNNNFDDLEKSRVMRKTLPDGEVKVIRANNGMTAALKLNPAGNLYACEMIGHRITELDTAGTVLRTVVGEYNGKRIDGPNDRVLDSKGGFYFTDSQFIGKEEKMQDKPAVYYVKPDGAVVRVAEDVVFPNGLALSPDGAVLYLANTQDKYLIAYDVAEDGALSNRRNFTEIELTPANTEKGVSGADGVAADSAGNVYVATTQGLGVQVFDSTGRHIGNIPCPAPTNNCSFGGPDFKTLYVSAKDGIYAIPTVNAGIKR
jgi:gluconolactonase